MCREHRAFENGRLRSGVCGSSPRVQGTLAPTGLHISCTGNSVHPRVCREHSSSQLLPSMLRVGSSPRVQGTLHLCTVRPACHPYGRFIPACAGNTHQQYDLINSLSRRFIPACAGNTLTPSPEVRPMAGSSPRVQGTRQAVEFYCKKWRFIPACAGNTRPVALQVCVRVYGSSPRVQGTRSR